MKPVIAVHGGAGALPRAKLTPAHEKRVRAALREALEAGHRILRRRGSALDAVTAAVTVLEDSGVFNAGRGACVNAAGEVELDASIMDGRSQRAGAVAIVRNIRNPIVAARRVMERTPHVVLGGQGAERFARREGLALVSSKYFFSKRRARHGTVGAVALDAHRNLAAATSTGGYTGKLPGRIGDSPIVGAGTWADNRSCAVSSTGTGEFFLRTAAAYDLAARMRYARLPLARAAAAALREVARLRGGGGFLALDRRGNLAMPFNTAGMYRAAVDRSGRVRVAIYRS